MGQTQSNYAQGDPHEFFHRKTMKEVDINRYAGTWWETAKYPLKWEQGCRRATAEYTYDEVNGVLKVENSCWADLSGKELIYSRSGEAWIPNMDDQGRMKLIFNDGLPSDGVSDYLIHWTDYDNYALVGGSNGQYFWILSRKEKIPSDDIDMLIDKVEEYKYDPEKLIWDGNVSGF